MSIVHVSSGHVLSKFQVKNGATVEVESGGRALDGRVLSGGSLVIESGGFATGTTVVGLAIVSGGSAFAGVVGANGTMDAVGGLVSGLKVASGGHLFVSAGAVERAATIASYGSNDVLAGGSSYGTVLNSYAEQQVSAGGMASGTVITPHGEQVVWSGGVASATRVDSTGVFIVRGVGIADLVLSGADVDVPAGGVLSRAGVASGADIGIYGSMVGGTMTNAALQVSSGGQASGVTMSGPTAAEFIDSSGFASGGTIIAGATLTVEFGGTEVGAKVVAGWVSAFGVLSGGTIEVAQVEVTGGGQTDGVVLSGAHAKELVDFGGYASGDLLLAGASLEVFGGGSATAVVIGAGATLELQLDATVSDLGFSGAGGTLVMTGVADSAGALTAISAGDTIDLAGFAWASHASARFLSTHVLAVSAGGHVFNVPINPTENLSGLTATVTADASGGSLVTISATVPNGGAVLATPVASMGVGFVPH